MFDVCNIIPWCHSQVWHRIAGREVLNSFEILKERLTTTPVLKQPDISKPFIIRTGASSYVPNGVHLQRSDPDEHVIEYAGRLLIAAERNYFTTLCEALEVVLP